MTTQKAKLQQMANTKILSVALIIITIVVISLVVFFSFYSGPPYSSSSHSTFTTNGYVVYAYPTTNQNAAISAKVGETFGVQLSSNGGSTGYDWNFTTSGGITFLNSTLVSSSNEPGAPVTYDYFFQVTRSGNQSILFQDKRQFTPYDVTATIRLQVTVSG